LAKFILSESDSEVTSETPLSAAYWSNELEISKTTSEVELESSMHQKGRAREEERIGMEEEQIEEERREGLVKEGAE